MLISGEFDVSIWKMEAVDWGQSAGSIFTAIFLPEEPQPELELT